MARGAPDFRKIAIIEKGFLYPELRIDPRVKYKVFFRSFPPESPLGPGATAKLIDLETNLETPVTIPAGYYSELIEWCCYTDTKLYLKVYLDGEYLGAFVFEAGSTVHEYELIVWASTRFRDPEAAESHTWDFIVENPTTASAIVFIHTALRIEKVGSSSYPRRVKCPKCGHIFKTDKNATRHKCPACGITFVTFLFGWWEG